MTIETDVNETPSVEHLFRVEGFVVLIREDEGTPDLWFPDFGGSGLCGLLGLYFELLLLEIVVETGAGEGEETSGAEGEWLPRDGIEMSDRGREGRLRRVRLRR